MFPSCRFLLTLDFINGLNKRLTDPTVKVKVINVLAKKLQADHEISPEKRRTKYSEIINFILDKDPDLVCIVISFIRFLLIEKLSQEFTDFRNVIAHTKDQKYPKIGLNQWIHGFKTLEFTARICVLNLLGFEYEDISRIHYLEKYDDAAIIRHIVDSNIEIELG